MVTLQEQLTKDTLAWIEEQGVVLQSAKGPVPNVAEYIAGEPIRGSWWGHPKGKLIYEILGVIDDDSSIVATRLVNAKVTLLHERVWPAIVRAGELLGVERLAVVHQEHTKSGAHRTWESPFPTWVSPSVMKSAAELTLDNAFAQLPDFLRPTT